MDPMRRDKKSLPLSGNVNAISSLIAMSLFFPVWFAGFLPIALVSQVFSGISSKFTYEKKLKTHNVDDSVSISFSSSKHPKSLNRKYDLILYGATGFTGKFAAKYLAKQYGTSFSWAIAGRRRDALESLRSELVAIDGTLANLPIVIADSSDLQSLSDMVESTKVIITTAGPFDKYGSDVVKYCAAYGTHYCDITGETDWVRKMIDKYDDVAKESGARIVHFCGHDCVPWDLTVMACALQLQKLDDTLDEINIYDELSGEISGGTLATIFHSLSGRKKYKSVLGFDPLIKTSAGGQAQQKTIIDNQKFFSYSKEYKAWVGPFVMAIVNANCVKRSNSVAGFSPSFIYREALVYPSLAAALASVLKQVYVFTCLFIPPLKWLFFKIGIVPNPGEGPSKDTLDKGFLKLTAFARGKAGNKCKSMMYFPDDAGYRETARMLVESGLVLALNMDQLPPNAAGVLTPATALGEILLGRLMKTGTSLQCDLISA